MELIKTPFHYIGNKYKSLEQILKLVPKCDVFVDLFCGSGVVGLNVAHRELAENVVLNDKSIQVVRLLECCLNSHSFIPVVKFINEMYSDDKAGYLEMRADYNNHETDDIIDSALLYCLIARSFSNDIRFNKSGGFNMPYGERNYLDVERITDALNHGGDVTITNKSYEAKLEALKSYSQSSGWECVAFIDPPYLNTIATYCSHWSEEDEINLYKQLDEATQAGVKWILTNTLTNRGVENKILKEWLDRNNFNVHNTQADYRNSSFRKSDKVTEEIIVTNYLTTETENV